MGSCSCIFRSRRDEDIAYYQDLSLQHIRKYSSFYTTSTGSGIAEQELDNMSDQYLSYILSDSSMEELREKYGLQLFRRSLTNVEYKRTIERS